ncbi:hypothetical protein [Arthrobacter sp. CG_A4]|uniref:hypothetical protein n=1 Tax=Arthrobacter sp. CG_A4 TaxID=3071706 RepID=UPI002E0F00E8
MKIAKTILAGTSATVLTLGSLLLGSAPTQAAPSCEISTWHEVDGYHGNIIFYPSFVCYKQVGSVAMTTYPTSPGQQWTIPAPGMWHSSYGVAVGIGGPGEYCALITIVVSSGLGPEKFTSRPCIWL